MNTRPETAGRNVGLHSRMAAFSLVIISLMPVAIQSSAAEKHYIGVAVGLFSLLISGWNLGTAIKCLVGEEETPNA